MTAYQQALSDAIVALRDAPEVSFVGHDRSNHRLTASVLMGAVIGLIMANRVPILLASMDAIMNMLDGYLYLARNAALIKHGCIIRCVAHKTDYTMALQHLTTTIRVYRVGGLSEGFLLTDLATAADRERIGTQAAKTIGRDCAFALSEAREGRSTVLVEYSDL